jgi:Domain of unknown function (DUF1918)
MDGKVGDRIVIGTDKVGQPAREGEILEVIDHESGTEFVVRWDDGHESAIRPHGGNARIVERSKAPSRG